MLSLEPVIYLFLFPPPGEGQRGKTAEAATEPGASWGKEEAEGGAGRAPGWAPAPFLSSLTSCSSWIWCMFLYVDSFSPFSRKGEAGGSETASKRSTERKESSGKESSTQQKEEERLAVRVRSCSCSCGHLFNFFFFFIHRLFFLFLHLFGMQERRRPWQQEEAWRRSWTRKERRESFVSPSVSLSVFLSFVLSLIHSLLSRRLSLPHNPCFSFVHIRNDN